MNKSTDQFIALKQDKRVLYEKGAEKDAKTIANKLDTAIRTIEQKQYRPFTKPVIVYVCNSVESFTDYCVQSRTSGCVLNERLFLSPKNFQPNRQALTHELSHLHIEQQLGMFTWHYDYPVWFQEGLAIYVSQGQGANKVSPEGARQAIAQGKSFTPNTSGSLIFRKAAHSFGLTPNIFYRQTAMFVEYLHNLDEKKFKAFLLSVEDGKDFEEAFSLVYGLVLNEIWKKFIQQQKAWQDARSVSSVSNHDIHKGYA